MTPSEKHAQSRCERLAHPDALFAPTPSAKVRAMRRLNLARALRREDKSRESTSVPPPSAPFGHGIGE